MRPTIPSSPYKGLETPVAIAAIAEEEPVVAAFDATLDPTLDPDAGVDVVAEVELVIVVCVCQSTRSFGSMLAAAHLSHYDCCDRRRDHDDEGLVIGICRCICARAHS